MASAQGQAAAPRQPETDDLRVVLLAIHGRDAALIGSLLDQERMDHTVTSSVDELVRVTGEDYRAGVIVLTEESADTAEIDELSRFLDAEPEWSDLPILMLARPDSNLDWLRANLNRRSGRVLRRPLQPATLLSAIQSAVEIRRRQHELRDLLSHLRRRTRQLRLLTLQLTDAEEQERRRFAVYVHDHLQQTLAGVMFHLELSERRIGDPEKLGSALERVRELVGEVIDGTRSLVYELSPVALRRNGLVAALKWLAGHVEELHGLRVNFTHGADANLPDDSTSVFLFRAAQELLVNVAKHARVDVAEIDLRRGSGVVELSIVDHGTGFAAEDFEDEDVPVTFGLFSLRERAELLGGAMRVESVPGAGTSVLLRVPFEPPTRRDDSVPRAPRRKTRRGSVQDRPDGCDDPIRVLVVDDHAVMRSGLLLVLTAQPGIEIVGECDNGKSAVEAADRVHPDVIVMDVGMPIMDGITATREIKRVHPEIRIIGLSMFDDPDTQDNMVAAGAERYLSKAGPSDDLLSAIFSPI